MKLHLQRSRCVSAHSTNAVTYRLLLTASSVALTRCGGLQLKTGKFQSRMIRGRSLCLIVCYQNGVKVPMRSFAPSHRGILIQQAEKKGGPQVLRTTTPKLQAYITKFVASTFGVETLALSTTSPASQFLQIFSSRAQAVDTEACKR